MQLASSEVTPSVEENDEEEEAEGETTLYFDAEEGTLRDADGDEVTLEMGTEDEYENEEQEGEQEEGSQTPQAQRPQTITSMSNTQPQTTRPVGRLRRLSSATQARVSGDVGRNDQADTW